MELKVTQIGNSLGVVLPKSMIESLNVEKGDLLFANKSESGFNLSPYDSEFAEQMAVARKIMKEHRNALREMSK